MQPEEVVQAFARLWVDQPHVALGLVADDVVYRLNVGPDNIQVGGETVGWEAVSAKFLALRGDFDYLLYRLSVMSIDGQKIRTRTEIMYRHRASGEIFSGFQRSTFVIVDGKISTVDEFVDAALLETFMRLYGSERRPVPKDPAEG